MTVFLNLIYVLLLVALSPIFLCRSFRRGKYRRGLWQKISGRVPGREGENPCVWFHGVSVGEIHLLRHVVAGFRQRHPTWDCVISSTTETGYEEAIKHFPDLQVIYWPLDFSWAVRNALGKVKPRIVILAEGELWPNFLFAARRFAIPVAVINARMSPRSFRTFDRFRVLVRPLFRSFDLLAVQNEEYARCYQRLSVPADRVHITGSVKFDGVHADRHNSQTLKLREILAVQKGQLIWVAGSTQEPEEDIVLCIYESLKAKYPALRLFLVPRQKDRFDAVSALLTKTGHSFARRSQVAVGTPERSAIVLIDTIGELGALWGLADIAFVGGSLDGRRGGQNMIEPAAYGVPVVFGPHVWNFREIACSLVEKDAAIQVKDALELECAMNMLAENAEVRHRLGSAAHDFVREQQGATRKTLDLLDLFLTGNVCPEKAA